MCSRESCSVVPSRFLAGLLIFLGAFLIAMCAVALWTQKLQFFAPASTDTRNTFSGCKNPDQLSIQVRYDVARVNGLPIAVVEIANDGSESVFYYPFDMWVRAEAAPFEYPAAAPQTRAFDEIEISPGQTRYYPLKSQSVVEAIFRYRVGDDRLFHSITTRFDRRGRQYCK